MRLLMEIEFNNKLKTVDMKLKIFILTALVVCSCAKSDMPYFDATSGVDFLYSGGKSIRFSFTSKPDINDYNYDVPIRIVGNAVDYDRTVNVSVLADSTTATSADYQIVGGTVKANEYTGSVTVKLINTEILKTKTLRLWIELDYSKDFIKGNVENKSFELLWENRLAEPANWRYYGFGTYSTTIHEFMIKTLGMSYIEYGYPDDPNVPNVPYLLIQAYAAKMKAALRAYNKENPNAPLRHADGKKKDELVVIP